MRKYIDINEQSYTAKNMFAYLLSPQGFLTYNIEHVSTQSMRL